MKKLIITFLILALFLTGCSTPAPAADNTPSNNNPNNESIENPGDNENTENNQNPAPTEKTPATQITNEGQPQDENDDFLFVFKGKSGYFARGERMELEIEIINNTGKPHGYIGIGDFVANPRLYCVNNGEEYVLSEDLDDSNADASYREVAPGGSEKDTFCYTIPADAPLGEYTLTCFYNGFRKDFKGYFTLE